MRSNQYLTSLSALSPVRGSTPSATPKYLALDQANSSNITVKQFLPAFLSLTVGIDIQSSQCCGLKGVIAVK